MSDIDLLVHQTDLPIIEQALGLAGYLLETNRKYERHYQNTNPDFTIHIDVHIRLPYLDDSALCEVWARTRRINLVMPPPKAFGVAGTGTETLILSPEDALIYAATDALIYHGRLGEVALRDMALIIKDNVHPLNWSNVIRIIKQYQLESLLYYAFSVVNPVRSGIKERNKLCKNMEPNAIDASNGANQMTKAIPPPERCRAGSVSGQIIIPEWVLKAIKPSGWKTLELRFYQSMFRSGSFINNDLAPVIRFITRPERFQVLLGSFLPSRDFMVQRYGVKYRRLVYLYYPFRIVSHFGRLIKLINQLLWSTN